MMNAFAGMGEPIKIFAETPFTWYLIFIAILLAPIHYIGVKDLYKYSASVTTIPESWKENDDELGEFFEGVFDELVRHESTQKHTQPWMRFTEIVYSDPGSSFSVRVRVPVETEKDRNTCIVLQVLEERDIPILEEWKELVGMALGIEPGDQPHLSSQTPPQSSNTT
jgi:hypothetical protein